LSPHGKTGRRAEGHGGLPSQQAALKFLTKTSQGRMVKMADTHGGDPCAARFEGSNPSPATILRRN